MGERLPLAFYTRDVLEVAPDLMGKKLYRRGDDGEFSVHIISEVEAYRGSEDLACHASRGKTPRTEVMFREGGILYMYFIYGMYWMMNIVTSVPGIPQAVLIRGTLDIKGPGRLTRDLGIDGSFNYESLLHSDRIWIEESGNMPVYSTHPRIGIDYAGDYWKNKPWRFVLG